MAQLSILLIKQLCQEFENIQRITSTSDFKLFSIYDKDGNILISSLHNPSNVLILSNIKTFAWQEDNYNLNEYVLLTVNELHEICYTVVKIKYTNEQHCVLDGDICIKWTFEKVFTQFHYLTKKLENVSTFEILKFEAKEAVFLFDKKTVVSFFLCLSSAPQIMSILELSDSGISYRKVLFMKEMLFVLNDSGTKFHVYSFMNDANIFEYEFSENDFKTKESYAIQTFSINIKGDTVVFVTENRQLYLMSLNFWPEEKSTANTVTAFTKQYPSVKGVSDNLRRFPVSPGVLLPVSFSCNVSTLILEKLLIIENKILFLYHGTQKSVVGLHALDADEGTLYEEIQQNVYLIENSSQEVMGPILLYFDKKISLLCYDIEQNRLVNELMVYPSSGAVEKLTSLNNWNSIQMDIEVLRLGLSDRKIYTVEFYLKTLFEGFRELWKLPSSESWCEKIESACINWENILNLVLENICQNISENIAYQYAEQLLQIAMSMMIQILDVMEKREADSYFLESEKELMLINISKLLVKMRHLLREQEKDKFEPSSYKKLADPLHLKESYVKRWEKCQPEDVIQESLLMGTVLQAQSYFLCHQDLDNASFKQFEKICDSLVENYLRQDGISEALSILLNMGINIDSKLLDIFKSTPDIFIRTLVRKELYNRNLLTTFKKEILTFLSILEKLYPCSSFEHAQLLLSEKSSLSSSDVVCALPPNEDNLIVGDFLTYNEDNSENGAYCRIVLDLILSWDDSIKSRILAPYFQKSSFLEYCNEKETDVEIVSFSLWNYFLENGHIQHIFNWIENWLLSKDEYKSSVFANWPISDAMINAVPKRAALHVSETILNVLAKHGIFCNEELEDTALFLSRVGRSQCNVIDMNAVASSKSPTSFPDLIHKLVHYCLDHSLVHFLCFIFHSNIEKFSMWPLCNLCDIPLFHLVKAFSLWSVSFNDSRLAYDALFQLQQHNLGLHNVSAYQLLLSSSLPLWLGILLLKPQPLMQSIEEALISSDASTQSIKEKFRAYPLLYRFFFKSSLERLHPDITVYELLKGNGMFDTSQLFGWQLSNVFKSEDTVAELPHFSLRSLSEQYGLKKDLTYLYYLLQGRPNYAYLKFIAQEAMVENGLSQERIKASFKDVTDYALLNFKSPEITLACILFTELIGQDSFPIRTCLTAANLLYESGALDDGEEKAKSIPKIYKLFRLANADKSLASDLISKMEQIILKDWNTTESNCLMDEIILWMPVMRLSHVFGGVAGEAYLFECAKQNKWLKFLTFAQIFQIPKDQVLKVASRFSNSCIYYHIFHALQRKPSILFEVVAKTNTLSSHPAKDMRKSLYSRIGVIKDRADSKKDSDPDDDQISTSSEDTSSSADLDIGSFVLNDLFSQLLLVHKSDVPATYLLQCSFEIRNPVLAVFAASHPESSIERCLFVWLFSTLSHNPDSKKELDVVFSEKHLTTINTDDIEHLMVFCVRNKYFLILWQAVCIFLPTTPLLPLSEFLRDFLLCKKFDASIESFQNQLWDYPRNCHHNSIIESALWLENISVSLLKTAVIFCCNNYERLILLRHFSHTRLEKSFAKDVIVPPFIKICQMLKHAGDAGHGIDVEKWFLPESNASYKSMCWEVLKQLLQLHRLSDAEAFAMVARLPLEDLMLLQMNQSVKEVRENPSWSDLSFRIVFWKSIIDKFKQSAYDPQISVEFLESQIEYSDKYGEKYFLMKSILNILRSSPESMVSEMSVHDLGIWRKKMWWWCIKAEISNELLPELFDVVPMNDFNFTDVSFDIVSSCSMEKEEKEALSRIIDRFLINKDLKRAFELATMFGYKSEDLEIIQVCLQLARHEISPDGVNLSIPQKSVETLPSRFIESLLSWICAVNIETLTEHRNIIICLHNLSKISEATIAICHHILVHYVVSLVLQESYDSIVRRNDYCNILKFLLSKKLNDEYVLAKCFITVHNISDEIVANFLSSEIWHSLTISCVFDLIYIPDEQASLSDELVYDPFHARERFRLLMKLCSDPAVLGKALLNMYNEKTSELTAKSPENNFSYAIELCICAHECFTHVCDIDGISQILHNCQFLITCMDEAKLFPLMVRLFTGIGRYSEMMYVFEILKKSDKLSLLFEKLVEPTSQQPDSNIVPDKGKIKDIVGPANLRFALIDYLKRLPPAEFESYLLYSDTKNFGLYREKAEILEMSVQRQLSQLCKRNAENDLKEELEKALHFLSEAAKNYCKAECLHQAQNCAQLAQLVALQIFFLPDGIWIIGLDSASVSRFITEHNKFHQSFIIAEHYGGHDLWSQALLNNYVMRGDVDYFHDFQSQITLSESLLSDITKRFLRLPVKSQSAVRNMKSLIRLCQNIKVKYSLILELGYEDMKSELLMGEGSSYLQDLIANNLLHSQQSLP